MNFSENKTELNALEISLEYNFLVSKSMQQFTLNSGRRLFFFTAYF